MINIKIALLTIVSIVLFSNFTCEKIEIEKTTQVVYLSYGTSFGECLGYCKREITVSGGITFTKSGWDTDGLLPDSSCSMTFIRDPLPDYLDDIDLDAFLALDETIGCPDCADGGAEWLELGFENEVKRVTFEYMNEPSELKDVIPSLRDAMESFNDCR
ncbi:hypothetical protein ACFLRQ_02855 [Bacteroidota bacterium]